MRFLLALILSSYFFVASASGNGTKAWEKLLVSNATDKVSAEDFIDYSFSNNPSKAVIPFNVHSQPTHHYRLNPFINFANPTISIQRVDAFYKPKHVVNAGLYCKRLGLKLIFPEHYFW